MILFHVTKGSNVESIRNHGLIPGFCKGLAYNVDKGWPHVPNWLTDSPHYVMTMQVGSKYSTRHDVKILAIDTSGLDVYSRCCSILLQPSAYEYICFDTIPPEKIL